MIAFCGTKRLAIGPDDFANASSLGPIAGRLGAAKWHDGFQSLNEKITSEYFINSMARFSQNLSEDGHPSSFSAGSLISH